MRTFHVLLLLALGLAFGSGAGGGFLLGHRHGLQSRMVRVLCSDQTRRDTTIWLSDAENRCQEADRGRGISLPRQAPEPVIYISHVALVNRHCTAEWRWTAPAQDRPPVGVSWDAAGDPPLCLQSHAPNVQ